MTQVGREWARSGDKGPGQRGMTQVRREWVRSDGQDPDQTGKGRPISNCLYDERHLLSSLSSPSRLLTIFTMTISLHTSRQADMLLNIFNSTPEHSRTSFWLECTALVCTSCVHAVYTLIKSSTSSAVT